MLLLRFSVIQQQTAVFLSVMPCNHWHILSEGLLSNWPNDVSLWNCSMRSLCDNVSFNLSGKTFIAAAVPAHAEPWGSMSGLCRHTHPHAHMRTHTQAVGPALLSRPDAELSTLYLSEGMIWAAEVLEKQDLGTTNSSLRQITQRERQVQRFIQEYNLSLIRVHRKSAVVCLKNGCTFDLYWQLEIFLCTLGFSLLHSHKTRLQSIDSLWSCLVYVGVADIWRVSVQSRAYTVRCEPISDLIFKMYNSHWRWTKYELCHTQCKGGNEGQQSAANPSSALIARLSISAFFSLYLCEVTNP